MEYDTKQSGREGCVFCAVAGGRLDNGVALPLPPGFVVFPALEQRPGNRGHMLLVPIVHATTLETLPSDLTRGLGQALRSAAAAVKEAFSATGVTVKANLGPPAQGIAHLHVLSCHGTRTTGSTPPHRPRSPWRSGSTRPPPWRPS